MAPIDTSARHDALVTSLRGTIARLARRLRHEAVAADDITPTQFTTLSSLGAEGPMTQGELAALEQVQPPTMTRIVAKLEEAGWVTRTVDPADRRFVRVALTSAGESFLERSRTRRDQFLAGRVAALDSDDRELLVRAMPVLERLLGDDK
jgi:DNA-binding MarR family transcriptional regulator